MSHGYTISDQMFSVREIPWVQGVRTIDGLGTVKVSVLDEYPGREVAERESGLAWKVEESEVFRRIERQDVYGSGTGSQVSFPKLPGWKLLQRSDNGELLHVARDSYGVVQNAVGFDILELLLDADSNVRYETGGSLKGGAQCYITARVDEPFQIDGDDSVTFPYVVVTWAHDGSGAVQARYTNVRVVCANTLGASDLESKRSGRNFTFRHTSNVNARIEDAKKALAGVREETNVFIEAANELAAIVISSEQRHEFVERFLPIPTESLATERVIANARAEQEKVLGLLVNSPTIPDAHRYTAYGLVLAGSEYADHLRRFRNQDTYLSRTLMRENPLKAKLTDLVKEVVAA
jgi:phage/plasmid-like protein (TIGR03299 family)